MNRNLSLAAESAALALSEGREDAHDLAVMALADFSSGDHESCERLLAAAIERGGDVPSVLVCAATIRRQQGRLREAVLACDAAIRAAPTYADAWLERGAVLAAGGSAAAARASYAEAARLAPDDANALAALAALHARDGDSSRAASTARAALRLEPSNPTAIGALASAELAQGDASHVPLLIEPVVNALPCPSPERLFLWSVLGDAWHKLGKPELAMAAWIRSKADFANLCANPPGSPLTHQQFVEAIRDGLARAPAGNRTVPPSNTRTERYGAPRRHAFVLGYPRSGNTMVENILASLPGCAALEERPTLAETDRTYLAGNREQIAAGLAHFAQADADELDRLRAAYWERVRAAGIGPDKDLFVDMDPLKGTRLPFIARLFPDARIIVMRRDPRDVVLSCFRTNFALTSGTLEYSSIARAAAHYRAMMELTDRVLTDLPLNVMEVHYDYLVHHFDATTQKLCEFVGLPWTTAVREFGQTANKRGVSTASSAQVRRGLYDGTRQWQPYIAWLQPVIPQLKPWIDRFGCDD